MTGGRGPAEVLRPAQDTRLSRPGAWHVRCAAQKRRVPDAGCCQAHGAAWTCSQISRSGLRCEPGQRLQLCPLRHQSSHPTRTIASRRISCPVGVYVVSATGACACALYAALLAVHTPATVSLAMHRLHGLVADGASDLLEVTASSPANTFQLALATCSARGRPNEERTFAGALCSALLPLT